MARGSPLPMPFEFLLLILRERGNSAQRETRGEGGGPRVFALLGKPEQGTDERSEPSDSLGKRLRRQTRRRSELVSGDSGSLHGADCAGRGGQELCYYRCRQRRF